MQREAIKKDKEAQKDTAQVPSFSSPGFRTLLQLDCFPDLGFPEIPCILK